MKKKEQYLHERIDELEKKLRKQIKKVCSIAGHSFKADLLSDNNGQPKPVIQFYCPVCNFYINKAIWELTDKDKKIIPKGMLNFWKSKND